MKPTKNLFFCYIANRTKLRFETRKKADRFIEFNQFEILKQNNKAPIRSYYCDACQCFHVTSKIQHSNLSDEKFIKLNNLISDCWFKLNLTINSTNIKYKKQNLVKIGKTILKLNALFLSSYDKKLIIRFNTLKSVLIYNEFFLDLFIDDKSTKISTKANDKILILKGNKSFNRINTLNTWERVLNPI
jgi:hypothetical protein